MKVINNDETHFVRFIPESQVEHEFLFGRLGDDGIYLQEMVVSYGSDRHKQIIEFMETIPEPGISIKLLGHHLEIISQDKNTVKLVKFLPKK